MYIYSYICLYTHPFFYLLRRGSSVWVKMFLLWSSCTKQKRVAPHSSLMPRLLSPPGAIWAVIRSERLVRLSIKNDLPCNSVNRKEHMKVYWQLQCKACWLRLSSLLAAMQTMVGDYALVLLVPLFELCWEGVDGWGIEVQSWPTIPLALDTISKMHMPWKQDLRQLGI